MNNGMHRAADPGALAWAAGLLIALIYGVCMAWLVPHDGLWIMDSGCKLIQAEGLVRGGGAYDIRWPGAALDPELKWAPIPYPFGLQIGGRLFLQYPPLFALVSSLPYRFMGFSGLYLLPCLAGLLLLPAVYGIAREAGGRPGAAPLAVLLTGLAGPVWFYSLSFWEHTLALAMLGWAVWAGLRHLRSGNAAPLAAAGLLCGLAVYFRDELYLWIGVWGAVLLVLSPRRRAFWAFPAAALLALAPLWWFNAGAVGHPLGHHFAQASDTFAPASFITDRAEVIRNLFLRAHPQPLLSLLVSVPLLGLWLWRPRLAGDRGRMAAGFMLLTAAAGVVSLVGVAAAGSPLHALLQSNGLFSAAPLLALGFLRFPPDGEAGAQARKALLALLTGFAVLYAASAPPLSAQGIHWGCRFLLPLYPCMAVLTAHALARLWDVRSARPAAVLAVAVALLAQGYSVWLLAQRQAFTRDVARAVAARPERAVVTNDPLLTGAYLAPLFHDRLIFLARTTDEAARVQERLRKEGIRELAWITTAVPGSPKPPGAIRLEDRRLRFVAVDILPVRDAAP